MIAGPSARVVTPCPRRSGASRRSSRRQPGATSRPNVTSDVRADRGPRPVPESPTSARDRCGTRCSRRRAARASARSAARLRDVGALDGAGLPAAVGAELPDERGDLPASRVVSSGRRLGSWARSCRVVTSPSISGTMALASAPTSWSRRPWISSKSGPAVAASRMCSTSGSSSNRSAASVQQRGGLDDPDGLPVHAGQARLDAFDVTVGGQARVESGAIR